MGNLLFLLGIQVPDQGVAFVDQNDQLIQQQLLSSLLGLRLLPVYNHKRGTNSFRPGHSMCFHCHKNLDVLCPMDDKFYDDVWTKQHSGKRTVPPEHFPQTCF